MQPFIVGVFVEVVRMRKKNFLISLQLFWLQTERVNTALLFLKKSWLLCLWSPSKAHMTLSIVKDNTNPPLMFITKTDSGQIGTNMSIKYQRLFKWCRFLKRNSPSTIWNTNYIHKKKQPKKPVLTSSFVFAHPITWLICRVLWCWTYTPTPQQHHHSDHWIKTAYSKKRKEIQGVSKYPWRFLTWLERGRERETLSCLHKQPARLHNLFWNRSPIEQTVFMLTSI